jgi:outer membrane lipoprotein LolB
MQENLGWSVPVKNYYYWVRGIPAPHLPYQKTMDRYHHIQTLSQQGWRIDYLSYQSYQGIDIPRKIRLRYGKLTLLWVTQLWQS